MKKLFAPGCTLKSYKPELIAAMTGFLQSRNIIDGVYPVCCKAGQPMQEDTLIINCCPGCNRQFSTDSHVQVVSLWRVLLHTDFPFPDYHGKQMTIHDACHARGRNASEMQESVRKLCAKMNISLIEPALTRDETPCCGGCAKSIETRKQMACSRCESLPLDDVVLYCTGCVRSFSVTKATPHHLLDLIYHEPTEGLTIKI